MVAVFRRKKQSNATSARFAGPNYGADYPGMFGNKKGIIVSGN
jgi:hypothetical protein